MNRERKAFGYIYPEEAKVCLERGCIFLQKANEIYVCQPGVLADRGAQTPGGKSGYMKTYSGSFPKEGCARNFHLRHEMWRSKYAQKPRIIT
jgi:hypothetical protein